MFIDIEIRNLPPKGFEEGTVEEETVVVALVPELGVDSAEVGALTAVVGLEEDSVVGFGVGEGLPCVDSLVVGAFVLAVIDAVLFGGVVLLAVGPALPVVAPFVVET